MSRAPERLELPLVQSIARDSGPYSTAIPRRNMRIRTSPHTPDLKDQQQNLVILRVATIIFFFKVPV